MSNKPLKTPASGPESASASSNKKVATPVLQTGSNTTPVASKGNKNPPEGKTNPISSSSTTQPKSELEKRKVSFSQHKANVESSLQQLNQINKSLATTTQKMGNETKSVSASALKDTPKGDTSSKEQQQRKDVLLETEDALEKKYYAEEEMDAEQMLAKQKAEELDKCYEWIDKAQNRVLFNTSLLVLIAALMTAFACYIFVQLPAAIYSSHILREVFLYNDPIAESNGFQRGLGIRIITPLPVVIVILYIIILYFIYMVQYPKRKRYAIYCRYCLFLILELYLLICSLSYFIDIGNIEKRLDTFHVYDKNGLKLLWGKFPKEGKEKLHFLDRTQEYFGCCGYRSKSEWQEALKEVYGAGVDKANPEPTWPLSCCDEELSGVACYKPVREMITYYKRNDPDHEEPDLVAKHVEPRLYSKPCFEAEYDLCMVVISMVNLLVAIFSLLSTWNIILFIKLTHMVHSQNLELRQKEQFIDFF